MKRRALLAATAAGLAGCAGLPARETATATPTDVEALPLAEQGYPSTVCESDPIDVDIPAIDDPAFGTGWSDVEVPSRYEGGLGDDQAVVGLVGDGRARAYPVAVLYRHEIVNDTFAPAGGPLLVTYCSLCRSGVVAGRTVDGRATTFRVSGQLWVPPAVRTRAAEADDRVFAVEEGDADPDGVRNTGNLVMIDDATGSYWSQLLARAICGPGRGTRLPVVPARTATWGDWRREHPDTAVLLPPPHSGVVP